MNENGEDIIVSKIDDVHISVSCKEAGTAMELSDFFTFTAPNARFVPSYRHKVWDGKIRLYNAYNRKLYHGLLPYVAKFAKERNYSIGFAGKFQFANPMAKNLTTDTVAAFFDFLNASAGGNVLKPLPHQLKGVYHAIRNERTLLLSPTGSGKSFIAYALMRYYADLFANSERISENLRSKGILLVVPTIGLVSQMCNDFIDYSSLNNWNVRENCHLIYTGKEKNTDKPVTISTWQSIYKLPAEFFSKFGAVIIDEAHQMKANSIRGIMEKLSCCPFRFGMTGTLDGMQTNKLVVEGLTGLVHQVATSSGLIDAGILSHLEIECLTLDYPKDVAKQCKQFTYDQEIDFLVTHPLRNEFISRLALGLKGNTLVLFQYVEKHGKILHAFIEKLNKNKERKIFFVSGEVEADIRESIRQITEQQNDAIIVASYGTFSTGINIKRLHNVIFAHPSKGRVRVLQSIGRQLRKSEDKEVARLYDISDNLCHKSHINYGIKHQIERINLYNDERFSYTMKSVKIAEMDTTNEQQ